MEGRTTNRRGMRHPGMPVAMSKEKVTKGTWSKLLKYCKNYWAFIIIAIILEVYLLANDKYRYVRVSINHLSTVLQRNKNIDTINLMAKELNRLYIEYVREYAKFKKFYPNIIVWLDAIIFRLDTYKKISQILIDKSSIIKDARDLLEKERPFYQCNEYQQEILNDVTKLKNEDNSIVVKNILDRIITEFNRQNYDNTRNRILNSVSLIIGITGILLRQSQQ